MSVYSSHVIARLVRATGYERRHLSLQFYGLVFRMLLVTNMTVIYVPCSDSRAFSSLIEIEAVKYPHKHYIYCGIYVIVTLAL